MTKTNLPLHISSFFMKTNLITELNSLDLKPLDMSNLVMNKHRAGLELILS